MAKLQNFPTLAAEEKQLVREALEHANAVLLPLVATLGVTPLTFAQRDALRDALLDEFCATGLRANDEPNQRGFALERLIDNLGHLQPTRLWAGLAACPQ